LNPDVDGEEPAEHRDRPLADADAAPHEKETHDEGGPAPGGYRRHLDMPGKQEGTDDTGGARSGYYDQAAPVRTRSVPVPRAQRAGALVADPPVERPGRSASGWRL